MRRSPDEQRIAAHRARIPLDPARASPTSLPAVTSVASSVNGARDRGQGKLADASCWRARKGRNRGQQLVVASGGKRKQDVFGDGRVVARGGIRSERAEGRADDVTRAGTDREHPRNEPLAPPLRPARLRDSCAVHSAVAHRWPAYSSRRPTYGPGSTSSQRSRSAKGTRLDGSSSSRSASAATASLPRLDSTRAMSRATRHAMASADPRDSSSRSACFSRSRSSLRAERKSARSELTIRDFSARAAPNARRRWDRPATFSTPAEHLPRRRTASTNESARAKKARDVAASRRVVSERSCQRGWTAPTAIRARRSAGRTCRRR